MAKPLRKPPSVSEANDFRAREAFDNDLHAHLRMAASATVDVPSIAAGGIQTFTVTVHGARPNQGQTVQVGMPSGFNTGLVPYGYVSANETVTVVLYNRTGGAIDPPSGIYGVRVQP